MLLRSKQHKTENVMFNKVKPPWRNGLACWTSNSKVVGSSPTGGEILLFEKYPNTGFQSSLYFSLNIDARETGPRSFTVRCVTPVEASLRWYEVTEINTPKFSHSCLAHIRCSKFSY